VPEGVVVAVGVGGVTPVAGVGDVGVSG